MIKIQKQDDDRRLVAWMESLLQRTNFRGKRRPISSLPYPHGSIRDLRINNIALMRLDLADPLQRIMWMDGYERLDTEFIFKFLRPATTFVDVGANVGWFTIHAADWLRENGRVIAFEPDPQNVEQLSANIELSQLSNVFLHKCAVSNRIGRAAFHNTSRVQNSGWGHLVNNNDSKDQDILQVSVTTLDEALKETTIENWPIGCIKIDVEGHELQVLSGAQQTLAHFRPVLMIEVGHSSESSSDKIAEFLNPFGYYPRLSTGERGLEALKPHGKGPYNVFFTC